MEEEQHKDMKVQRSQSKSVMNAIQLLKPMTHQEKHDHFGVVDMADTDNTVIMLFKQDFSQHWVS